jgi:hypothetical protein
MAEAADLLLSQGSGLAGGTSIAGQQGDDVVRHVLLGFNDGVVGIADFVDTIEQ